MKIYQLIPVLPLLLAGCGLQPVKDNSTHHLLDPAIAERRITGSTPALAIARPSLPAYLDRQQLVSRNAAGELHLHDNQLWAEPLAAGISRVLALNLGRLTNSLNIQPVDYFVGDDYQSLLELRISRFEADASNQVVLECSWKVQPVAGPVATSHAFNTVVLPAATGSHDRYHDRVTAMNEALARLARAIARTL